MTRVKLTKKDVSTSNPLAGAVYGIYKDKNCTSLLLQTSATGTDGKAFSDYFEAAIKTVYSKEITAPTGYVKNDTVYIVPVEAVGTYYEMAESSEIIYSNFPQGFCHVTRNKYGILCN